MWIASDERGHSSHQVSKVAVLGNFQTDAQKAQYEEARRRARNQGGKEIDSDEENSAEETDDEEDDDVSLSEAVVTSKHTRTGAKVTRARSPSPPPTSRSHKKKRPRIESISPPPTHRKVTISDYTGKHPQPLAIASTSLNRFAPAPPRALHYSSHQSQLASTSQSQSQPQSRFQPPHLPQQNAPAPTSSRRVDPFEGDLTRFLQDLTTCKVITYAPLLIELGITNFSSITSLIMMDEQNLKRFGELLKRGATRNGGITMIERLLLIQKLTSLRKELESGNAS